MPLVLVSDARADYSGLSVFARRIRRDVSAGRRPRRVATSARLSGLSRVDAVSAPVAYFTLAS